MHVFMCACHCVFLFMLERDMCRNRVVVANICCHDHVRNWRSRCVCACV